MCYKVTSACAEPGAQQRDLEAATEATSKHAEEQDVWWLLLI